MGSKLRFRCWVKGLALALGLAVAGPGVTTADALALTPWVARHDLTSSAYQGAFDDFVRKGFRLTNVSGYLKDGGVRYAALWHKKSGPPWVARHGMTGAAYQKAFDDYVEKGYRLTYVNGFWAGNKVLYAAIWEKKTGPAWIARHGLDGPKYQQLFDELTKKGYRQTHISGYAEGGSARYAVIFEKSSGPAWLTHPAMTSSQYQAKYDEYGKKGFRVTMVSGYRVGDTDRYAAMWEKVSGPVMRARHGIRGPKYQTTFDVDRYQGYRPKFVNGFTSKGMARFNTIWESPFSAADLKKIKDEFAAFLKDEKVAGLSVAIAKDGKLLYASGFGRADVENKVSMHVNHRLRIGSSSKSSTAAAIFRLIDQGATFGGKKLTLDSKVFGSGGVLTGITVPSNVSGLTNATVRDFLEHATGLPRGPDPVAPTVSCALSLDKRIEKVLKDNVAALDMTQNYSNLGYIILERVIEVVSGKSYESYVRSDVYAPSKITAPRLFKIGPFQPTSGEPKHYKANGSYAEYTPGGTCDSKPPGVGAGGWAMSAKDLLRFLVSVDGQGSELLKGATRTDMVTHTVGSSGYAKGWIINGWGWCGTNRNVVQGHNGGLSGGFSNFFILDDGYSFAVAGNQDATGICGGDASIVKTLNVINSVSWPSHDLW